MEALLRMWMLHAHDFRCAKTVKALKKPVKMTLNGIGMLLY
jgi:hypothetical protein